MRKHRHVFRFATPMLLAGVLIAHAEAPTKSPFGQLPAIPASTGSDNTKLIYRFLAHEEAAKAGLPPDLVDAVMKIESGYDASRIGGVGEIGLMQVRPGTAALLGFRGAVADLAKPAINIHYGATYLGQAWRLAKGDVCRTLMKYRAGHGEEVMTPLSVLYCARARAHLASIGSPLAAGSGPVAMLETPPRAEADAEKSARPKRVARPLHGSAFWVAQEARVRAATARVEAKWRRMASR